MNQSIRRRGALHWLAAAGLATQFPAMAQPANWPSKPLRWIVPYPAGGTPDSTSRSVGEQVARKGAGMGGSDQYYCCNRSNYDYGGS
jgi:tripartite-type tricarboxylate transporter receptor subunit TctC